MSHKAKELHIVCGWRGTLCGRGKRATDNPDEATCRRCLQAAEANGLMEKRRALPAGNR